MNRILWFACVLCLVPVVGRATTITDASVVIGTDTYTASSVGWTFPVTLATGQSLVLTQTAGGNGSGFDTSDGHGTPTVSITADGVVRGFVDTQGILSVKDQGSVATDLNEAQRYTLMFSAPGYDVYLGYADNIHTGPCGAYAATLSLAESSTCFPGTPFADATVFEGAGGVSPESLHLIQTNPGHCGWDNCYDAGVIRIEATGAPQVPEPASIGLLGVGLLGVGAVIRKRRAR